MPKIREPYPRWTAIEAALTGTIALATKALGIHWTVDLIGGVAPIGSVAVALFSLTALERRRLH
jgi:hypothetical protein